jgi:hypothetical protein
MKRPLKTAATGSKKKFGRGKNPASHKPKQPKQLPPLPPLSPDEIVRVVDAPRYFGVRATNLRMYIKLGQIPAPLVLVGHAKGWRGQTILEWQRKRSEKLAGSS